uniref:Uncharacterized protein n=1 Tax=Salix viminalis TaxID=40686 RepID=A0A6N2NDA8_SALVM
MESKSDHEEYEIQTLDINGEEPEATVSEAEKRKPFENRSWFIDTYGAFCESLRLYPPVPTESKSPRRQDIVPSCRQVYPSTKILFSLHSMGRMTSVRGDQCIQFKPE